MMKRALSRLSHGAISWGVALVISAPNVAEAQVPPPTAAPTPPVKQPKHWNSVVEASASTLFGATSQTLASFGTSVSHRGEDFSADASAKFYYGEAKDANSVTFVSARSWALAMSADAQAKSTVSPFFSGNLESSLEKRVDRRIAGGAGARLSVTTPSTGAATLSVALMGEQITPLVPDSVEAEPTTNARWQCRLKTEQQIIDRVKFSHTTSYSPVFNEGGRYTISSTSTGSFDLSRAVALTLTLVDNYDSEAQDRGARTNNDGSLLFGVRGRF